MSTKSPPLLDQTAAFVEGILMDPLGAQLAGCLAFAVSASVLYAATSLFMRIWLVFLALFELFPLYNILVHDAPLSGFAVNLADWPAERRLWMFGLLMLMLARLNAFAAPASRAARVHVAAVHAAELALFYAEQRAHALAKCPATFAPIFFDPPDWPTTAQNAYVQHLVHPLGCAGGGSPLVLKVVAANALLFAMWACATIGPPAQGHALPFGLKRD